MASKFQNVLFFVIAMFVFPMAKNLGE